MGLGLKRAEVGLLCKEMDRDGNGHVNYQEFASQILAHHTTNLASKSGKIHNAMKELL